MDFGYSSRQGGIKSGRFDPIPSLLWSRKTRETGSNIYKTLQNESILSFLSRIFQ